MRPPQTGPPHGRIEPLAIAVTAGSHLQICWMSRSSRTRPIQHVPRRLRDGKAEQGIYEQCGLSGWLKPHFSFHSTSWFSFPVLHALRLLRYLGGQFSFCPSAPPRPAKCSSKWPLIFVFCSPILEHEIQEHGDQLATATLSPKKFNFVLLFPKMRCRFTTHSGLISRSHSSEFSPVQVIKKH